MQPTPLKKLLEPLYRKLLRQQKSVKETQWLISELEQKLPPTK